MGLSKPGSGMLWAFDVCILLLAESEGCGENLSGRSDDALEPGNAILR